MEDAQIIDLLVSIKEDIGELKAGVKNLDRKVKLICDDRDEIRKNISKMNEEIATHRTYFKIIGSLLAIIVTVVSALISGGRI